MFNIEEYNRLSRFASPNSKIETVLYQLQMNNHREITHSMFLCTGLDESRPYFYCQTGLPKSLYADRLHIDGSVYSALHHSALEPALYRLLDKCGMYGLVYMITDDSKELGVVFQPGPSSACTPLSLADQIDARIQSIYEAHFPQGTGRYRNSTALSKPVYGENGVREGYIQTEQLKQAAFFLAAPGALTEERLHAAMNQTNYRDVIALCRETCRACAEGDSSQAQTLARQLFLDTLKRSFSTELVGDALSYIKQFLSVYQTVYLPEEELDLSALCRMQTYAVIEECFDALLPVLLHLCAAAKEAGSWSDAVVYAAYFMRIHLDRDIALPEIAAFANTTPSYLSGLFHQQTGLTVKQYHTRIRVERARFLLAHSELQIQEIAARLGFLNRRYFTATFKSAVGVTPQEYRAALSD